MHIDCEQKFSNCDGQRFTLEIGQHVHPLLPSCQPYQMRGLNGQNTPDLCSHGALKK
ncbi:hypothetical protein RHMOL_Rhmol05G0159400 [Rhododendron molle]|uniref:Uncharacterized protein n=1 Tax=Rhododendron molle TaxID=49168 RepID=A0ACC0NR66_RHOML|nr:hypothetical protein RHMOL_Rhmol05G0159400 [Rhododendron molle]